MYGALSAIPPEPKVEKPREKKARQATKVSDLKETQTQTLEEAETSDNITDKIVLNVYKTLVEKFKENGRKPINFFKFALHPNKFGASIENMVGISSVVLLTNILILNSVPRKLPHQGEQSRCEDLRRDQDAAHRAFDHQEEGEGVLGGDGKVPGSDEHGRYQWSVVSEKFS